MSPWILLAKRKEECFPGGIFVPLVCGMLVAWADFASLPSLCFPFLNRTIWNDYQVCIFFLIRGEVSIADDPHIY